MLPAFWHMPTHPPPLICPTLAHPHKPDLGSARPLLPPHLIFSILSPLKACKSSVGAPSKVGESSCTCVSTNSRFISPPIRHPRPLVWLCCLLNVCALSATPALSYAIVLCVACVSLGRCLADNAHIHMQHTTQSRRREPVSPITRIH